jgi:hypothetical protein
MKIEKRECSEMSAYIIQTLGDHPKERIQHFRTWRKFEIKNLYFILLLPGAELPVVESFGLLNNLFPFPSIVDASYPVFLNL